MKKTYFKISVLGILSLFFFLPSVVSAGTLRKPPNNLGLVAYWPFDENGGMTAGDASGNGHTGTLLGTAALPTWVSGKLGKALSFPGGSSDTKVTFSPISVGTVHTISMWVYLTADCTNYADLFSQDDQKGLWCLKSGGVNKLTYYQAGNNFNNTALALNRWYHVAVTSDGVVTTTFYLNGVADGGISGSLITYSANTMGSDPSLEALSGKIDDVRVYNRTLSASEVLALYKSGAVQVGNSYKSPGTLSTGLTAHYTFDGKDMVNKVENVAGAARKGTLVGFTSTTTVPGKVGQALTFNGTSNYVSSTGVAGFMSSATGTISVWLRPTGNAINRTSAQMYSGQHAVSCSCVFGSFGISRANLTDLGQDKIWAWTYASSVGYVVGVPYVVGEWIHVTWVHANGILSAYKNGDFVGSVAYGNLANFSGNLYVGGGWSGSPGWWSGDIDEFRTYNRDLSAAEIKQLYNLTLGTKVNKPSVNSLTNGLVGYYTFDGGDTDRSTNTMVNRGSVGGTAAFVSMATSTSPVPGKVGQGMTFNGTSGYLDLGSSSSLKISSGSYSVSFWYKGLRGTKESFFSSGATCCAAWFDITSTGVDISNAAQSLSMLYNLPRDNDWHHMVAVFDRVPSPDTVNIYIDGVSQGVGTGDLNNQSLLTTDSSYIGRNAWATGSNKRQGPMDEVRIYNRALSAADVLKLYRMGK